jgi:hypothetical protein
MKVIAIICLIALTTAQIEYIYADYTDGTEFTPAPKFYLEDPEPTPEPKPDPTPSQKNHLFLITSSVL